MKFFRNPAAAIFIMIAVMLISTLIGVRRSLTEERERVTEYFITGTDGGEYSITEELEYISNQANSLKIIAARYMDSEDEYIKLLDTTRAKLSDAETPSAKHQAAADLITAVSMLYGYLGSGEAGKLNSTDESFRTSLYKDITSAAARIEENSYNSLAGEFNAMLDSAVTGWLGRIVGIEAIELYK